MEQAAELLADIFSGDNVHSVLLGCILLIMYLIRRTVRQFNASLEEKINQSVTLNLQNTEEISEIKDNHTKMIGVLAELVTKVDRNEKDIEKLHNEKT